MASFSLILKSKRSSALCLNATDVFDRFLFGIPNTSYKGDVYNAASVERDILSTQKELENLLDIKICPTLVTESIDYNYQDWTSFGYLRTKYPVNKVLTLSGYLGQIKQVEYPSQWLSIHETSDNAKWRHVYVVPSSAGSVEFNQNSLAVAGMTLHVGLQSNNFIPNFWRLTYCSGFDVIPADLLDFIGRFTALKTLSKTSDAMLALGLSSQSITIDGLSQSRNFNQNSQSLLFGGRFTQLYKELEIALPSLKSVYQGITTQTF